VASCIALGIKLEAENFYRSFSSIIPILLGTVIMDIIWLVAFTQDWLGKMKTDGGNEGFIRILVLFLSVVSFILRVRI
jgi:hypothetical protein